MYGWCLLSIGICTATIVAGTMVLSRAQGVRVVSGRSSANFAYISLFGTLILVSLVTCVAYRVHGTLSHNPQLSGLIQFFLIAAPAALLIVCVCLWRAARRFGRSIIFHNVSRDELAEALAAGLREMRLPASRRLRTFTDEFSLAGGRILIHGFVGMSSMELIGLAGDVRCRIVDTTITRLKSSLESRGRGIIDQRPARMMA